MALQITLQQAAERLNCPVPEQQGAITGAQIDSRHIQQGDLFVAIAGERVDGHQYLAAARQAGASAALVSELQSDPLPQLLVEDVVEAFGQLAQLWREKSDCKTVAVTGSNGKTTVKEMLATILSQSHTIIATQGNLNNHLGVPLTLFRIQAETDYAVIEMGANHKGEIRGLVQMAQPQVAMINNVSAAHIEGFGSLQGVAEAKGEIFSSLEASDTGVVNADMPYLPYWQELLADSQVKTFALETDADIKATDCQSHVTSSHFMIEIGGVYHYIDLPLPGRHNVANALAAIAVCNALHIAPEDMVNGLAAMKGVNHRLQLRAGPNNTTLIDDSYNANPGSYQQALATLQTFPGEHWLVLGDFGELGEDSERIHTELGQQAATAEITRLLTVGEQSQLAQQAFTGQGQHFSGLSDLQSYLENELTEQVTCLIKGSRFMQLDKLADQLAVEDTH